MSNGLHDINLTARRLALVTLHRLVLAPLLSARKLRSKVSSAAALQCSDHKRVQRRVIKALTMQVRVCRVS